MSLIITTKSMRMQDYEQDKIEEDAKNKIPKNLGEESWRYVAGLSWLFLDEDFLYQNK